MLRYGERTASGRLGAGSDRRRAARRRGGRRRTPRRRWRRRWRRPRRRRVRPGRRAGRRPAAGRPPPRRGRRPAAPERASRPRRLTEGASLHGEPMPPWAYPPPADPAPPRRRMMIDINEHISAVRREVGTRTLEAGEARVVTLTRTYGAPVDDVWDACTSVERIPRWFLPITGDLRVGGRYQLQGNAGGVVERCDPPRSFAATWEFGGDVSSIEVRLRPGPGGRHRADPGARGPRRRRVLGPVRPGRGRPRVGGGPAGAGRAPGLARRAEAGRVRGLGRVRRGPRVHDAQRAAMARRAHRGRRGPGGGRRVGGADGGVLHRQPRAPTRARRPARRRSDRAPSGTAGRTGGRWSGRRRTGPPTWVRRTGRACRDDRSRRAVAKRSSRRIAAGSSSSSTSSGGTFEPRASPVRRYRTSAGVGTRSSGRASGPAR